MDAMTHCRQVLARSGSSFAASFRLLPPARRDALTAFYAYCREVDDAVDDATDPHRARAAVAEWRRHVDSVFVGPPRGPVAAALADACARFPIRREHLDLVLDGVEADLTKRRYDTFDELYGYCYRVASSVGLACLAVLGETSPDAVRYGELTGIGVQLTNILRDVGEDAAKDRIYLPRADLEAFGVPEEALRGGRLTPALARLLRFQAARARHYLDLGGASLPPGARRRLFFTEALRDTYAALLDRIEFEGFPVLSRRVRVGAVRRLSIVLGHGLRPAAWRGMQ